MPPSWARTCARDERAIAAATEATLALADARKLRSVALPAFGTGVGGYPHYDCARIMLAEIVRYLTRHPKTHLQLVVFSAFDAVTKAAFTHALTGIERP